MLPHVEKLYIKSVISIYLNAECQTFWQNCDKLNEPHSFNDFLEVLGLKEKSRFIII